MPDSLWIMLLILYFSIRFQANTNMLLSDCIHLVIFCYCRQCYVAVFLHRERIFVIDE